MLRSYQWGGVEWVAHRILVSAPGPLRLIVKLMVLSYVCVCVGQRRKSVYEAQWSI